MKQDFKISIEAASTDCWKKYIGTEGLAFGIDSTMPGYF